MIRAATALAALALGLTACANLQSANEVGGVVHFGTGLNSRKAFELADAHCHRFGKAARVTSRTIYDNTMTFECVTTDGR